MLLKKGIELLAPAKNYECGLAAINHGADAVYIAAQRFGAREAAGNSISNIEKLAIYAHRYYAKVYLVLNTILYENEIEPANKLIHKAYECGCDAVIIQDMGLLETNLPPIPLFASTQTHNYTVEKVKFLESVGFKRVILARELSLEQIAAIRQQTSVDLEAFVHGALCVSYSGQCYMSCAATGRSANKGACAQLCRLPYDLIDEQGTILVKQKHLLSLRDLNLSEYLEELINAGITSFKIEGRLKDLSYVKNITALYRQKIDTILNTSSALKKASSGTVSVNFEPNAESSFSRSFTNYFINGRSNNLASFNSPKSTGQYIGKIYSTDQISFLVDTSIKLNNGDGICFIDKLGNLKGTRINKVEEKRVYPLSMKDIHVNLKIYRNHDFLFEKSLLNKSSAIRQIYVVIKFESDAHNIKITATDEDNIKTILHITQCGTIAKNQNLAIESLKEQLAKTGGTPFIFEIEQIVSDQIYFYTSSQINSWRRELIKHIENERNKHIKLDFSLITPNDTPYYEDSINYTTNVSNSFAEKFYLRHGIKNISHCFETNGAEANSPIMFNRYCIKYEMGICPNKQGGKTTGNLFIRYKNRTYKLIFNCTKCEMQIIAI